MPANPFVAVVRELAANPGHWLVTCFACGETLTTCHQRLAELIAGWHRDGHGGTDDAIRERVEAEFAHLLAETPPP